MLPRVIGLSALVLSLAACQPGTDNAPKTTANEAAKPAETAPAVAAPTPAPQAEPAKEPAKTDAGAAASTSMSGGMGGMGGMSGMDAQQGAVEKAKEVQGTVDNAAKETDKATEKAK